MSVAWCGCRHMALDHKQEHPIHWNPLVAISGECTKCDCQRFLMEYEEQTVNHGAHRKLGMAKLGATCPPCYVAKLDWMASQPEGSMPWTAAQRIKSRERPS